MNVVVLVVLVVAVLRTFLPGLLLALGLGLTLDPALGRGLGLRMSWASFGSTNVAKFTHSLAIIPAALKSAADGPKKTGLFIRRNWTCDSSVIASKAQLISIPTVI